MRLSTLGLVSLIAGSFAAPVFANPASISGSNTFITPAGFTSTVSGENVLPSGLVYLTPPASITNPIGPNIPVIITNPSVTVTPTYNLLGFSVATTSLTIGSPTGATLASVPGSFSDSAARVLTQAAAASAAAGTPAEGRAFGTTYFSGNIEFISAIIKAGAGVNGLD